MSDQLFCIGTDGDQRHPGQPTWRLDEHTKTIGRNGIAAARAALAESRPKYDHDDPIAA